MKITGEALCPTCNKEHPVSIDIDKLEVKTPQAPILTNASTQTALQVQNTEVLEPPKEITRIMPSKDEPFLECKTCNKSHSNPNYSVRPANKCNNCGTLNGSYRKGCKTCGGSEFEELSEDELDEKGIPKPVLEKHEHEEET